VAQPNQHCPVYTFKPRIRYANPLLLPPQIYSIRVPRGVSSVPAPIYVSPQRMLDALRETGWRHYSLFLRDDGLLVGYFETPDLQAALVEMESKQVNARWQAEMAPFFEDLDGKRPDEGFLRLPEVFHLD